MAKTVVENKEQVLVGEGRDFERIRRITGYLVGTIDRWNNAKRAEEKGPGEAHPFQPVREDCHTREGRMGRPTRSSFPKETAAKEREVWN